MADYRWLRWGVLLAGLANVLMVAWLVAEGNAVMITGNVAAAAVCIGTFVWVQRGGWPVVPSPAMTPEEPDTPAQPEPDQPAPDQPEQ